MKKKYTKKQIQEAISYWQKRLNESQQFSPRVQEILDAFANMSLEKTKDLEQLTTTHTSIPPEDIDDVIDDSFWDIDIVLDNIENTDIDNSIHITFQYNAANVIKLAAEANYTEAKRLANAWPAYLIEKSKKNPELFIEGWRSHINEPTQVLMALYNILDEKFNLKNYSIDYTAWHMDKYTVDVKARSEAEAKNIFFKDHAHEEYDMKDFEITSIKEN